MASTSISTWPTAVKSTPCPTTKSFIDAIIEACLSSPSARRWSTTWSFVVPAGTCRRGSCRARRRRSGRWPRPRIRGPSDISPTLATASDDTAIALASLGRHPADEPLGRRTEVVGLLADHAAADRPATGAGTGLDALGLLQLLGAPPAAWRARCPSCCLLRAQLGGDDLLVGLAGRRAGRGAVPRPTTTPSSITRIRSASRIVDTRWATSRTVASP